ncbi:MAG TPA: 16S rRNA (cytosine(1402)-N(4))-methyltransferase RsmH [Candidatus Paceibacterota bacterium]|jgi:16S rRNA (cytosine1402-N4)-methyltransferase|nr:16S rRNA (cytosine(1402)-N(4))-methyltransferase RsmH [Candidatus Paceibacterota bacterium]
MAHRSVLLKEVLQYLAPEPGQFVIDGTVDGGGHAEAIMSEIMPEGNFLGLDWDKKMVEAREAARAGHAYGARERYLHRNYAELPEIIREEKLGLADGLLLDLGFSSEQLERSGRGFSFGDAHAGEPLYMTYDDAQTPVAELLRGVKENELARILFTLGGERLSRRIAKAIVEREKAHAITTSGELAEVVRGAVPAGYEKGRIDPATRTFQALRIYANDELGNLTRTLDSMPRIVKPGGRVVVISFHSLEDRIIKHSFQTSAKEGKAEILTKKPVVPSREEEEENPRSRSAKLRAATIT